MPLRPHNPGPRPIVLLATLFAIVGMAGCATPRDRYLAADRALLAAQTTATAAIASGYLDDKPAVRKSIVFGLNEANAASRQAKTFAVAGNDPDLAFWTDRMLEGVARATAQLQDKGAK